ncbi:hypothetical protein A5634_10180 [Mycobacterium asiaticum]|uniref:PknH-like extracellular domain-containing protein n=1 Tax=Mycobacterium asiaticum TaxID=1790 RepID=A0A1A3NM19_MYCAS|nr:hypothetical protein [Mycobacterium asiaticum]OBK21382.1 hypothetical protein A5634_10180 [Mycobacterium asiaticum]
MRAISARRASNSVAARGQQWLRLVGATALIVLGLCAAVLLIRAPGKSTTPTSLAAYTNWTLATALPVSADFPQDWGYSLTGRLQRPAPSTITPSAPSTPNPAAAEYAPDTCGNLPKILDHAGAVLAAFVHVDRYAQLFVQDAAPADAASTGESHEHGPNARFAIWVVPDGPAQIADYLSWLNRCGSYRVTNHFLDGEVKNRREVATSVEARAAEGADAAVTVTRRFTPIAGRDPASTYHVEYYAVRGVLLECTIYLEGAELEQVKQAAAQTVQRLRAL